MCEDIFEVRARERWNSEADEYNQWSELGQDEKDELIEREKNEEVSNNTEN